MSSRKRKSKNEPEKNFNSNSIVKILSNERHNSSIFSNKRLFKKILSLKKNENFKALQLNNEKDTDSDSEIIELLFGKNHSVIDMNDDDNTNDIRSNMKIINVWLDVMIVQNEICILTLPISCAAILNSVVEDSSQSSSTNLIENIMFDVKLNAQWKELSGRKKKDAAKVFVDSVLGYIKTKNDYYYILRTPIKGKLIEINEKLSQSKHSSLVQTDPGGEGYIAIMLPSTEIPSQEGKVRNIPRNACFDFLNGVCKRGDKCKFSHDIKIE